MDVDPLHPAPPPVPAEPGWRPLPPRARLLMMLGMLPVFVPAAPVLCFVLATIADLPSPLAFAAGGLLAGVALAAWRGLRRHRHFGWLLDEDGLAVRRGRMWQSETRVPATRVQHLDIRRGPIERGRGLATLVVHTAGTRLSSVTVPHMDAAEAERLRDALSRQIRDVDD